MEWDSCDGVVDDQRVQYIEEVIGRRLPIAYISSVKNCDQGYPRKSSFVYFDEYHQETWGSGVGCFLSLNESSLSSFIGAFFNSPEFFPKDLIAFAETGGGNFICFDYRQGKDNPDPPIVYWSHGANIGRDVSFIANNFEEFISILKEPDD